MIISSTEFQQNVGHYFDLAEQGEDVQIQKLKPLGSIFKLVKVKKAKSKKKSDIQMVMDKIAKYQFNSGGVETGLELQRRARS